MMATRSCEHESDKEHASGVGIDRSMRMVFLALSFSSLVHVGILFWPSMTDGEFVRTRPEFRCRGWLMIVQGCFFALVNEFVNGESRGKSQGWKDE